MKESSESETEQAPILEVEEGTRGGAGKGTFDGWSPRKMGGGPR